MIASDEPPHSFYIAVLQAYFDVLGVGASVCWYDHDPFWSRITDGQRAITTTHFEVSFDRSDARRRYNTKMLREATRANKTIIGHHCGFSDAFTPIVHRGRAIGGLAVGPFRERALRPGELTDNFKTISRRTARLGDPIFRAYVRAALDTVILHGGMRKNLVEFCDGFARLLAGAGYPTEIFTRLRPLWLEADEQACHRHMANVAQRLIDPTRSAAIQSRFGQNTVLASLLVGKRPTDVLVMLPELRDDNSDPLEAWVRASSMQHAAVGVARRHAETLAGRAGDHGVMLLTHTPASIGRSARRTALRKLARALMRLGGDHGFTVRVGIGSRSDEPNELPGRYLEALSAVEWALYSRTDVGFADETPATHFERALFTSEIVRELRTHVVQAQPAVLRAATERAGRALIERANGSLDALRAHVEHAIGGMLEEVDSRAVIDRAGVRELCAQLARATEAAQRPHDLLEVLARAADDLAAVVAHPRDADRAARLERARIFIERNHREALDLGRVAREAGYAPAHFSKLFRRHHGIGFEQFLLSVRVARAKALLGTTRLPVHRVALECGFTSYTHLARAFRRITGTTASHHRRAA